MVTQSRTFMINPVAIHLEIVVAHQFDRHVKPAQPGTGESTESRNAEFPEEKRIAAHAKASDMELSSRDGT